MHLTTADATSDDRIHRDQVIRAILRNAPVALLRVIWNVVPPMPVHGAWADEVFVQVVGKLEDVAFHRAGHYDIVDQAFGGQPISAERQWKGANLR